MALALDEDGHVHGICPATTGAFPAPATMETWVTDQDGDPVFMVAVEPSDSLAGELRRLLPALRQVVGESRRMTVCLDRGGWSPALFAGITAAGFDLLTCRNGLAPDLPAEAFTTVTCTDDRGRRHEYELADSTVERTTSATPAPGSPWTPSTATPATRMVPNPARKAAAARVRQAEAAAEAAEAARDTALLQLRSPAPGQAAYLTNQVINALAAPVEAAWRELEEADSAAAGPARHAGPAYGPP